MESQEITLRFIDAMNLHDPATMVALFADDGVFDDTANAPTGRPPIYVKGRDAILELFTRFFSRFEVRADLLRAEGNLLDYDVDNGEQLLSCHAEITAENGKIKYFKATPRE